MKILALNLPPLDLSYFSSRGLNLEVEYQPLCKVFLSKFLYQVSGQDGVKVDLYTPDVFQYLNDTYKTQQYSFILVGWNPSNYPDTFSHTGGYTYPIALNSGTYCSTIRVDGRESAYSTHELMHLIGLYINITIGDHTPKDYMDSMPVNGVWMPYYLNDTPNAPGGNFATTWELYKPFINQLNAITYQSTTPTPNVPPKGLYATITRNKSDTKETLGTLTAYNNGANFTCKTLELPWLQNKKNISCIPTGTYQVKLAFWLRKFGWYYQVQNVSGRSGIFLHEGNYYFNFEGCIGLGDSYADINNDGELDITNTRSRISAFKQFMGNQPFTLVIK